ncbi:MAG: hypothetical protein J6W26_03225 [Bacteroidales bacterium]|nr:hypothetical protein [Bacteroidales bacterium]
MIGNATLNCNEPLIDETLTAQLKDLFSAERQSPSKSVMNFIFGYAGAYEPVHSDILGLTGFMKN